MPFPADRTVVHATWTPGDVDCFALAPSVAARPLEITIDTPAEVDLGVELLVTERRSRRRTIPARAPPSADRDGPRAPAVIRVKARTARPPKAHTTSWSKKSAVRDQPAIRVDDLVVLALTN